MKSGFRKILGLIIFFSLSLQPLVYSQSHETSGSQNISWNPSRSKDGVATDVRIDWKISNYMSQIALIVKVSHSIRGDEIWIEGKSYSRREFEEATGEKIEVMDTSVVLGLSLFRNSWKLDNSDLHYSLFADKNSLYGGRTSLDQTFSVDNEEMREYYRENSLSLREFEVREIDFRNLQDARKYFEAKESKEKNITTLYNQAEYYYDAGEYELALDKYREILKVDPEQTSATVMVGKLENHLEQKDSHGSSESETTSKEGEEYGNDDYQEQIDRQTELIQETTDELDDISRDMASAMASSGGMSLTIAGGTFGLTTGNFSGLSIQIDFGNSPSFGMYIFMGGMFNFHYTPQNASLVQNDEVLGWTKLFRMEALATFTVGYYTLGDLWFSLTGQFGYSSTSPIKNEYLESYSCLPFRLAPEFGLHWFFCRADFDVLQVDLGDNPPAYFVKYNEDFHFSVTVGVRLFNN